MRFANKAIVAAGLGFAVSALVGCGGSGGLLSQSQADRLSGQLQLVADALSAGQCASAQSDLNTFQDKVDSLNSVNSTLIQNLDQGANTIAQLARRSCPTGTSTQRHIQTTPTKTTKTRTATTPVTITTVTDTTPTVTTTQTISTNGGTGLTTTTGTGSTTTTTGTTPNSGGGGLTTSTSTTSTTGTGTGTGTTPNTGGTGLGGQTSTTTTTATGTGAGGGGGF